VETRNRDNSQKGAAVLKNLTRHFRPHYISKYPNERMRYPKCTFLGKTMSQSFTSLFLWEKVLSAIEFARLIELGTSNGILSLYFYLFCLNKDAAFYSFDNEKKYIRTRAGDLLNFENTFRCCDVLKEPAAAGNIIREEGRTVLFCDNGDKIREFALYAPYLKSRDLICVHDWGQEIDFGSIREIVRRNRLKEAYRKYALKACSHIRMFEKTG